MKKYIQYHQLIKHGILSYSMTVDQVLISGQPGIQVTTTQTESLAKIQVYYLIVDGESRVHEPRPAKDQVQPNTDAETWFDFFEEARKRAMENRIARKADGRAHVFQYEENRYRASNGEMVLVFEQVLADGVPAVKTSLTKPTWHGVVYAAFTAPMPPLYLLDHPAQWTQTWMQVSQAALPEGKRGESWRPEKVEPNNDMDTYQDYLAWSLAVTRAREVQNNLPTTNELFS